MHRQGGNAPRSRPGERKCLTPPKSHHPVTPPRSSQAGATANEPSENDMSVAERTTSVAASDSSVEQSEDWRASAACRGETRLFFPPKAERPQARARRETKALRLCHDCPVQTPCQEFARQHREYGFWAGESEEERHLAGFTVAAPIGIRARGAGTPSDLRSQTG